jgi:hypothetical protein
MKAKLNLASEAAVIKDYPITGTVQGWYFKIQEVSAGVYVAEGTDLSGRKVSRQGADPEEELKKCMDDARQMTKL